MGLDAALYADDDEQLAYWRNAFTLDTTIKAFHGFPQKIDECDFDATTLLFLIRMHIEKKIDLELNSNDLRPVIEALREGKKVTYSG